MVDSSAQAGSSGARGLRGMWQRYLTWRRAENVVPARASAVDPVLKADISDDDLAQQSLALSQHMELGH